MIKDLLIWLGIYGAIDIVCILKLFPAPEYIPDKWYACAGLVFPISAPLTLGLIFGICLELWRNREVS
jgi:hypothetical protein